MFPFKRRTEGDARPDQPASESARADLAAPQQDPGGPPDNAADRWDDTAPGESQAARAAFALAERREHSLVSLIELLNALNVSMDLYEVILAYQHYRRPLSG